MNPWPSSAVLVTPTVQRCMCTANISTYPWGRSTFCCWIKRIYLQTPYFLWHWAFLESQIYISFQAVYCRPSGLTRKRSHSDTVIPEVKDYTSVHISADADRPSAPLSFLATFSPTTDSQPGYSRFRILFLHLPLVSELSVPDSLCTICCVHMRFAGSSLSTAEQQGDWSSQSGNRERSPVSEKCKYSAIQQPQSRRDRDENNSYYTAPTGREHRGQRG